MPNFEAKTARDEDLDPDQETALESVSGNPVAKTEVEMALKAAHQVLMGERAVTRDKNENAAEKEKEENK